MTVFSDCPFLESIEWIHTISLKSVEYSCMANVTLLPVACLKNIFILTCLPVRKEKRCCLVTVT